MKDIEEMLKALLGASEVNIKKLDLEDIKDKLSGKHEIANKVTEALGPTVKEILVHNHIRSDKKLMNDYATIMGVLCSLLDDGKIMLRKESK